MTDTQTHADNSKQLRRLNTQQQLSSTDGTLTEVWRDGEDGVGAADPDAWRGSRTYLAHTQNKINQENKITDHR